MLGTGVFGGNQSFDVFAEYAKAAPCTSFRRFGAATSGPGGRNVLGLYGHSPKRTGTIAASAHHAELSEYRLHCDGDVPLLFTENETNNARLFGGSNPTPFVKDSADEDVVNGRLDAVNPAGVGTKAAAHWVLNIAVGRTATIRLRLSGGGDTTARTGCGTCGAWSALLPATPPAGGRSSAAQRRFRPIRTGGTACSSTSISRRQR